MRIKLLVAFIVIISPFILKGLSTCETAQPFCTGTNYTFPASTNTTATTVANFGCIRILILES